MRPRIRRIHNQRVPPRTSERTNNGASGLVCRFSQPACGRGPSVDCARTLCQHGQSGTVPGCRSRNWRGHRFAYRRTVATIWSRLFTSRGCYEDTTNSRPISQPAFGIDAHPFRGHSARDPRPIRGHQNLRNLRGNACPVLKMRNTMPPLLLQPIASLLQLCSDNPASGALLNGLRFHA